MIIRNINRKITADDFYDLENQVEQLIRRQNLIFLALEKIIKILKDETRTN